MREQSDKSTSAKEDSASAVLVFCEKPNLGTCRAELGSFAREGAVSLFEWHCVPPEVIKDTEQLRRLFLREAQRMPEVLHLPARQLLYYAVAKAFPCPLRGR
jgi:Ssp1 endopeptidase immunity protein Rap1a